MTKVLVLGSDGLLGQAFCRVLENSSFHLSTHSRTEKSDINCDVIHQSDLLSRFISETKPDYIINCIALVSIHNCEKDKGQCMSINYRFVDWILEIAKENHANVVHISTDHFFTGDKNKLHSERDEVSLVNNYAKSKFLGEQSALKYERSLVVRTNITGFRGKKTNLTFFEWVLKIIHTREPVTLFNDFYTSTIDATSLVHYIIKLIELRAYGLFNIASSECYSKQEFINCVAARLHCRLGDVTVKSVSSLLPARAESLGLCVSKVEKILECRMPTQQQVIENLLQQASSYGVRLPHH